MSYTVEQKRIFAENVWLRRQMLGMSKEELAEACSCGTATINCWERGANIPPHPKMRELANILKCSIHDLFRIYNVPKLSFVDTNNVVKKKEEVIMSDEDIIKVASEVFKTPYVETSVEIVDKHKKHPVVDRVNKYLEDNQLSQNELAKRIHMSSASLNRVVRGMLIYNNPKYVKVEKYLDSVESNTPNETNETDLRLNETENKSASETKTVEIIKEQKTEDVRPKEKGSISERMSNIYDTLFNALAELDELKEDIAKIEKVTAMLKEIQGL